MPAPASSRPSPDAPPAGAAARSDVEAPSTSARSARSSSTRSARSSSARSRCSRSCSSPSSPAATASCRACPGWPRRCWSRRSARRWTCRSSRIQFTPDLMPSDITGTDILQEDPETGRRRFEFVTRPDLRQHPAGRRDQPHAAQDAGRPARGDAGAAGDGRQRTRSTCPTRSSCWPRRTRSSRKGPTRCPRPSSTGSCSW